MPKAPATTPDFDPVTPRRRAFPSRYRRSILEGASINLTPWTGFVCSGPRYPLSVAAQAPCQNGGQIRNRRDIFGQTTLQRRNSLFPFRCGSPPSSCWRGRHASPGHSSTCLEPLMSGLAGTLYTTKKMPPFPSTCIAIHRCRLVDPSARLIVSSG